MLKGGTFGAFLAGAGVEVMFIFLAAWTMSPYNSYRTARRFQRYLETRPEILDEVVTTPVGHRGQNSTLELEGAVSGSESAVYCTGDRLLSDVARARSGDGARVG